MTWLRYTISRPAHLFESGAPRSICNLAFRMDMRIPNEAEYRKCIYCLGALADRETVALVAARLQEPLRIVGNDMVRLVKPGTFAVRGFSMLGGKILR